MNEEITKLDDCVKAMRRCLDVPGVEHCVCYSDAFSVFELETERLGKKTKGFDKESREKFSVLQQEISVAKGRISKGEKECLGCATCMAAVVFNTYPDLLNEIYLKNDL
ncbi:MAG: hypothetical protein ABII64_01905 [Elusimicrobiota bacterium]